MTHAHSRQQNISVFVVPTRLVIDIASPRVAGIVDEHIDRRRGSSDIVKQRAYLLALHEIGLADPSAGIFFYLFEGVLRAFLVSAVVHEHVGALAGEGDGDRLANPARCAGHQYCFVLQVHWSPRRELNSGHADTAKTAELAGKIEQDFVAARPADEGQAGGTACYGADRQAYLRKAGNAGRARQAHGPYAEVLERLPRSGDKRSNRWRRR